MDINYVSFMSKYGSKWAIKASEWNPGQQEFENCLSQVQAEEQERIKKFRFEIDRKRALCGRLLIRRLISLLHNVPNDKIKIGRTEYNKPELVEPASNQK